MLAKSVILTQLETVIAQVSKHLLGEGVTPEKLQKIKPRDFLEIIYEHYAGAVNQIASEIDSEVIREALKSYTKALDEIIVQERAGLVRSVVQNGWLFVLSPKMDQTYRQHRIYLNVTPEDMHIAIGVILNFIRKHGSDYLANFKFADPRELGANPKELGRSDTLIVYLQYPNRMTKPYMDYYNQFVIAMRELKKVLRPEVPPFTKKIGRGIAFAADPRPTANTFAKDNKYTLHSKVSFGELVSMSIAISLYKYAEFVHSIPKPTDRNYKRAIAELAISAHNNLVNRFKHDLEAPSRVTF